MYSPTASPIIEAAALEVLEMEMVYTSGVALRQPVGTTLTDLEAAQLAYETAILTRTTAQGAVAS